MDVEVLKYAVENGIVDLSYVQEKYEMNKREEILKKHPYKIWEGKDGKWYTYLPDEKKGRALKKRNSKYDIETVAVEFWREKLENPTIREVFEEWNDRRLMLEKISKSTHNRNAQFFDRHYSEFGNQKIKAVAPDEIVDFLELQIPKHKLNAKAFAGLLGVTRGFLKYAKRKKLINFSVEETLNDMDLSESSFKKRIKEDCEEVFSVEETGKIVRYLEENMDIQNMGLLLLFVSGLRVGELAALKHSDFGEDSVKVRRTEVSYTDSSGEWHREIKEYPKSEAGIRTVILPRDYLWIVDKIRTVNPFSEYVFVDKTGKVMSTNCFRNRLYRVCKWLGIGKRSPHKIRKTYGTILMDNKVDNKLVMGQMGHADILVSENHYHRDRREHDEKARIISNIPDFKVS